MQLLIDDQLHELELRYKRSEQAERRLVEKRDESAQPCEEPDLSSHPALLALRRRQHKDASPTRAHSLTG